MTDAQPETLAVDFVVNVFERTYREVLRPGLIQAKAAGHFYPFTKTVLLINNVNDRVEVEAMVAPLLANGEVTEHYYVADLLEDTLSRAGIRLRKIQQTIHYSDCSLAAVFLAGSPYLLYSDADVLLESPIDWITPSLGLMNRDERIAAANPNWVNSSLKSEAREFKEGFGIGYGFSDQIYLIRRAEFAHPIYKHWVPISWRYPLSHIAPVFEQIVDSYLRSQRRLRATYMAGTYVHAAEEGATYKKVSLVLRLKRHLMLLVVKTCSLIPGNDPRFHM